MPSLQNAIDKLVELAARFGLSIASVDFLRNVLFGYIESYLNGATCPKCLSLLGKASEIPNFTICNNCNQKVGVIKITPLRFYLTIANNADLFEAIPDKIKKNPDQLRKIKPFSSAILKFYDAITIDMIMEPLLAWMKEKRPDLYYTLAFYPVIPKYIQILYEIDTNSINKKNLEKLYEELNLDPKKVDVKTLRKIIIKGLDSALEKRKEYYVFEGGELIGVFQRKKEAIKFVKKHPNKNLEMVKGLSINPYALKTFMWQLEMLKAKMRKVFKELVKD